MTYTPHTRPTVELDPHAPDSLLEALVAHHAATSQLLSQHDRLVDLVERLSTPAQVETVVINDRNNGQYTVESRERYELPVLSIGLLNPTSINIYFSGVGTASATTRAFAAPPNALIILPISAQMIEIAANPTDLGVNTAVVFLFRYFTVQPAFIGKGA